MDKDHLFFDNYADSWDSHRKENPALLTRLLQFCQIKPGASILDVGSGTGILLPYLQKAVGETGQIEELDFSRQMLARAAKKFPEFTNVTYSEKNILKYTPPEDAYDTILCLNLYPHIAWQKEHFIKKMAAALKKDGALVIMHDLPRSRVNAQQKGREKSEFLPPVDMLASLLVAAGLTITIAMDTDEFYFVQAVKKNELPYEEYPEPVFPGWQQEKTRAVHTHLHTHPHTETKAALNRLARISGHIEAIKRMLKEGRDCSEVLIQISAVDSALLSVGKLILRDHIDHCIVDAVHHQDEAAIDNLKKAISTFIK